LGARLLVNSRSLSTWFCIAGERGLSYLGNPVPCAGAKFFPVFARQSIVSQHLKSSRYQVLCSYQMPEQKALASG
jgi:hypothetical protein